MTNHTPLPAPSPQRRFSFKVTDLQDVALAAACLGTLIALGVPLKQAVQIVVVPLTMLMIAQRRRR